MALSDMNLDIPSPDDVMAQQAAQQQALQARGPAGQNLSAIQQFGAQLFGNPQLQRAKQIQEALSSANSQDTPTADPSNPNSDLDGEIARLQRMRNAVVNLDPNIANKINMQMLQLGTEKLERQKLLATTAETDARTGLVKQQTENATPSAANNAVDGMVYVLDPRTGRTTGFDLTKPENAPAFEKAKNMPGAAVLTGAQNMQLVSQKLAEDARMRAEQTRLAATADKGADRPQYTPDSIHEAAIVTATDPMRMKDYATYGNAGQDARTTITNERNRIMKQTGMTPEDLEQARAYVQANRGNAANLQKSLSMVSSYEALARNNGQRILDLADKLNLGGLGKDVSGLPISVAIDRAVQKHLISSQDAAEYTSVLGTFQPEVARIVNAGPSLNGVLSDTARKEMSEIVNGNLPVASLSRVINRLFTEFEVRRMGLGAELSDALHNSVALRSDGSQQTSPSTRPAFVFASEAEAEDAAQKGIIQPGQKITVGGQTGTWH